MTISSKDASTKALALAVEVQRCRFFLDTHLDFRKLPATARKFRKGFELVVPRPRLDELRSELNDSGISTFCLEDVLKALPKVTQKNPVDLPFKPYSIPSGMDTSPDKWFHFSFVSRTLRRSSKKGAVSEKGLLARQGQMLAYFEGSYKAYFIAGEDELEGVKNITAALLEMHAHSFQSKFLYRTLGSARLLYKNSVWLPGPHYWFVYRQLPFAESEGYLFYHQHDLPLVDQALRCLNIVLREGEPLEPNREALDFIGTISDLMKESYKEYLHNQNKVEDYAQLIKARNWHQVSSPRLKKMLVDISNRSYYNENAPQQLLQYLGNRLPLCVDWKDLRAAGQAHEIYGIVVDEQKSKYRGADVSPYYKMVLPNFEIMVGCRTSQEIGGKGNGGPRSFVVDQWRFNPFLGRLRLTPYTQLISARSSGEEIREGLETLLGIPTYEKILADKLYIDSFFLDLDPHLWKGHLEISRYFSGYGKLVQREVQEFDEPTSLMADVFGNHFYLAWDLPTYTRFRDWIEGSSLYRWKGFFAQANILKSYRVHYDAPVFQLVPGTTIKDVGFKSAVAPGTLIAILRYYKLSAEEELVEILRGFVGQAVVRETIKKLVDSGRVVVHKGKLYYKYNFVSKEEMKKLLEKRGRLKPGLEFIYKTLFCSEHYLAIIHPFRHGKSILEGKRFLNGYEVKYIKRAEERELVVTSDKVDGYIDKVKRFITKTGIVTLSSRGRWAGVAQEVASNLIRDYADEEPILLRHDTMLHHKGKDVPEIKHRVILKKVLMKRRLEGKFKVHN